MPAARGVERLGTRRLAAARSRSRRGTAAPCASHAQYRFLLTSAVSIYPSSRRGMSAVARGGTCRVLDDACGTGDRIAAEWATCTSPRRESKHAVTEANKSALQTTRSHTSLKLPPPAPTDPV